MTARSTKTATNEVSRLDGLSPMAFVLVAQLEQSPQDLVSATRAPAVVVRVGHSGLRFLRAVGLGRWCLSGELLRAGYVLDRGASVTRRELRCPVK